jgi:hypothetical protein
MLSVHALPQVHLCVNDCCRFDLEPNEYRQHVDDKCPHCQEKRFELKETAGGVRMLPRKVMYYFGVGAVIRDRMFTDPSFCKHRTTGRHEYFYTSQEAERLAAASGCDLNSREVSCYEVGVGLGADVQQQGALNRLPHAQVSSRGLFTVTQLGARVGQLQ